MFLIILCLSAGIGMTDLSDHFLALSPREQISVGALFS